MKPTKNTHVSLTVPAFRTQATSARSEPAKPTKRLLLWFTLVELIVVITILAILGTIGFLSIGGYSSKARDSARTGDVAQLSKSLDLSVVTAGTYPVPDNAFAVTYSGGTVWNQWTAWPVVIQYFKGTIAGGGMNKKPVDPLKNSEYTYSSLAFGNAYQIKADYENDIPNPTAYGRNQIVPTASADAGNLTIAYVRGNYGGLAAKTVTGSVTYVLAIPSIITNSGTTAGNLLRIENNALSGTLLFNGKPLLNASAYNPNARANSGVVFSGNGGLPGSDANGQLTDLVAKLKLAYAGSDVASSSNVASLLSATGTGAMQSLGTAMVSNQLGGKVTTGGGGTPAVSIYPGCDTADIALANGQVWAACNAGATNANTGAVLAVCGDSPTDCYIAYRNSLGGLYQWGRNDDVAPQATPVTSLASAGTTSSTVGHVNFIKTNSVPHDWISTRNNNLWGGSSTTTSAGKYADQTAPNQVLMQWPCASGYHVPTIREWCDAASSINPSITLCSSTWQNDTTVVSKLKLSLSGKRYHSASYYENQGINGYYWSSSPFSDYGYHLNVSSIQVIPANNNYSHRADGFSVRCLKN